ncbi:MAG TPA: oligosaccharide flippase family protein [Candidatus Methanoperedenaceae archaeon]|nr:oligosaccharide flippase family protein [Candidatus Methanoperedenaceae archaeon]
MLDLLFSRLMRIGDVQRQSIVTFVWQIAYTAIGFLSTMYFAHAVGAEVLGAYFLFLAYLGIFSLAADGGLGGAAVKRISEGEEPDAYFSTFFVLRSVLVIATVLLLIVFRDYFVDLNMSRVFTWLLLALAVSIFHGAIAYGVAGSGKMGIFTTCVFIDNVSRVAVQVSATILGYGVGGLAGGVVAGLLISALIEVRFFDLHPVRFGWKHIKSLTSFSFWLFLTSSGYMVFTYADTVMIGYFMENADVGVYRVVLQLTLAATFTTHAMLQTLWPKVSRWGKTKETGLIETSLSRAITYSLLLAVPVLAGGILLGDRLLYFFYGAQFERGYTALVLLLFVQVVNVFQHFFTSYLSALDRQKEAFRVTAIAASANIAMNIVLIPLAGIAGAAVATLATMVLNAALAGSALSGLIKIRVESGSLFNIFSASLVMSLLILGYRMLVPLSNIWLTLVPVVLGAAVFIGLLMRLDSRIRNELREIAGSIYLPSKYWM